MKTCNRVHLRVRRAVTAYWISVQSTGAEPLGASAYSAGCPAQQLNTPGIPPNNLLHIARDSSSFSPCNIVGKTAPGMVASIFMQRCFGSNHALPKHDA